MGPETLVESAQTSGQFAWRSGDPGDEWGLPGVTVAHYRLAPVRPAPACPFLSSYLPVLSAIEPGARSLDFSIPISAGLHRCSSHMSLWRRTRWSWTGVGLTDRLLTPHCWHTGLSFPSPTQAPPPHVLTSAAGKGEWKEHAETFFFAADLFCFILLRRSGNRDEWLIFFDLFDKQTVPEKVQKTWGLAVGWAREDVLMQRRGHLAEILSGHRLVPPPAVCF